MAGKTLSADQDESVVGVTRRETSSVVEDQTVFAGLAIGVGFTAASGATFVAWVTDSVDQDPTVFSVARSCASAVFVDLFIFVNAGDTIGVGRS